MARPRIRYSPNIAGVRRIMTGEQMAGVMERRARAAIPYAQGAAPDDTHEYDNSFDVEVTRRGGPRGNRAEARLTNTAAHAPEVERRYRVLGQTVDYIERGGP